MSDIRDILLGGGFDPDGGSDAATVTWGKSGAIQYIPTSSSVGRSFPVLDFSKPRMQPRAFTLTVGLSNSGGGTYPTPIDPATGLPYCYRCVVNLSYGVAGYTTRQIQFDLGQQVSFAGNFANATVEMLVPPTGYVAGSLMVGAALGFGATMGQSPVVCTRYFDALGAGLTAATAVPPRARAILPVQMSDDTNGQARMRLLDTNGALITGFLFGCGAMVGPMPMNSMGDAYMIQITNTGPIAQNFRIPVQISL